MYELSLLARFWHGLLRFFGVNTPAEQEALPYMNRVDAALNRKPRIGPCLLSLGSLALLGLFVLWAASADIDEVTHGQGQVIPARRTQIIENLEGGILRNILVHEGQIVQKDALLARIDNTGAESVYRDAMSKTLEHQVALTRLMAERSDGTPLYGEDIHDKAPLIIDDQMALFAANIEQRKSEREMLESQLQQRLRDVEEQKGRKLQMERSLALAKEQMDIARPLLERKIYSRVEYLGLEQKVVTLQGDLAALSSSIPKAVAAAQEAQQKLNQHAAEIDTRISEEINKRRTELASLRETIAAGNDRMTRTDLRSPVRGTVKQVLLNTLGGVVKPGEPIMEIVPLDDTLLIEVRIRPADIAFIRPDQPAMVKISAYDFSIYGGLEGHVEQIGADTIEDRRGELYYLIKLRTAKNAISYRNQSLPIIPGMVATVDIMTGKKTILDYLMKPILKAQQNALRER